MKNSPLATHLLELSETLAPHLPGSANRAVAKMRQHALERLAATGVPKITDEAWRYTNLRAFDKSQFKPTGEALASLNETELKSVEIPGFKRDLIVLVDGWINEAHSTLDTLPEGVQCTRLKDVLDGSNACNTIELLESKVRAAEHGFEALNAAVVADGIVLHVAAGVKLEKPIEILHISRNDADARLSNVIHFVSLAEGAKLDLVERYVSLAPTSHMTNASVRLDVGEAAELNHYRVQNESCAALHLGYATAEQKQHSRYRIFSISIGALLDRHEVKQCLTGPHSHCEMKGLYIGSGKQHIDNYTTVVHASPDASSDEFYKGILADRGRSVFHGRIKVNQDAQHTDAQQQNRNLLLSANAEAATKPQLEIYADDVKCSHGATVGYLESDAIFYLQSRGLSESAARAILTEAFAAEIIEQVDLIAVRDHLLELSSSKLADVHAYQEAA